MLGSISFWFQMLSSLLIQSVVSALFAAICYQLIVRQRGSKWSYLVGFGIIIPSALVAPFFFVKCFGIINIAVMIGASALAFIVPFACVEAMYDTSPRGVESSLTRYIGYYSSIIPFERDPDTGEPKRISRKAFSSSAVKFLRHQALVVVMLMILIHYDFRLFPSPREPNEFLPQSILQIFHWGHLLNNFILAYFTAECIETGSRGVSLAVVALTGCQVMELMQNPILDSQSPSEFWGKRWNLMLHGSFKRGIFLPLSVKHKVPRGVAVLVTFVVSGLLHEYVCCIIQLRSQLYPDLASKKYEPLIGRHFLFFLWNASVVILERAVSHRTLFQRIKKNFPRPAVTALVLLTVLPISHWFTDEYIRSGFYSDYSMGFPLIVYHPNAIE